MHFRQPCDVRSEWSVRPPAVSLLRRLVAALLVATCVALPGRAAAEEDDPFDPLTVRSLTAAQAAAVVANQALQPPAVISWGLLGRSLDATLSAAGATPEQIARLRQEASRENPLGFIQINAEPFIEPFLTQTRSPEWQRLANSFSTWLLLPALTELTPDVAAELARSKTCLSLAGLTSLSPEAARALTAAAAHRRLDLSGLKTLSPEVAKILAGYPGSLDLSGLVDLSPESAAAIAQHPGDTNLAGLAELTPAEAEPFTATAKVGFQVANFSGLKSVSPELAAVLARLQIPVLRLTGIESLSVEAAAALAAFKGSLDLSGVTSLTPPAAAALAAFGTEGKVCLVLGGIEQLSPEVAAALARSPAARLHLAGVRKLSAESAAALARCRGVVSLPGLVECQPAVAEALGGHAGAGLELGMPTLDAATATALAKAGGGLHLTGLTTLSADTAKALATHAGPLHFRAVEALSPEVVAALADHAGPLFFVSLRQLSPEAADAIAACRAAFWMPLQNLDSVPLATKLLRESPGVVREASVMSAAVAAMVAEQANRDNFGMVELKGLADLPADVASALARCRAGVALPALGSIAPDAAAAFSAHPGHLDLDGLQFLDVQTADALAARPTSARLRLNGLTSLAPDVAAAFSRYAGALELPGLPFLEPDVAAALATHPGELQLDGVAALSPESVEALAQCRSLLTLGGLTSLDSPALAAVLARSDNVALPALKTLGKDAARALGTCPGRLTLGLMSLDVEGATTLARLGTPLILPRITALDSEDAVAVAGALAQTQAALSLPGLRRASAKTLMALMKKADVHLPPVETIELIPEPDGSPNEDLVVPEAFRARNPVPAPRR